MLNQTQRDRLQLIHSYEWASLPGEDANANLAAIYKAIDSTEELWFASFIIPLDVESGQLSLVLDHPLCDRGVASFVYWTLDPCGANTPAVDRVLAELKARLLAGYYSRDVVKFSPMMLERKRCDKIPSELCAEVDGIELPLDYRSAVFGDT